MKNEILIDWQRFQRKVAVKREQEGKGNMMMTAIRGLCLASIDIAVQRLFFYYYVYITTMHYKE